MRRRIRIQPWWVLGAVLVLLFVILLITYAVGGTQSASAPEQVVGDTVNPVMSWTHSATTGIKEFFGRLFGTRDIDKEYEQMKARLAQLELESEWAQELAKENERLTELLGFAEYYPQYEYMYASVISRDPESWYSTLTINRGENQGIQLNMAVVTQDGLLGRVIEVLANSSTVMTIIDRQSAVAAVLERSRDNGILKGATDQESSDPICNLVYLPFGADLVPGDQVLSSGMGGFYPKGLPLGEVVEVSRQSNLQSYATVRPYVDFAHIEDVLVITGEKVIEATAEPQTQDDDTGDGTADDGTTDDDTANIGTADGDGSQDQDTGGDTP